MKLLIADDEEYTREGLVGSIDWNEMGIEEIMQAKDGREALEICEWFQPDIVLTDIKMPMMDGIEFVDNLLKRSPLCKILFMTGSALTSKLFYSCLSQNFYSFFRPSFGLF